MPWQATTDPAVTALVRQFVNQMGGAQSTADIRNGLEAFTGEIGFRHFALIHHTDLRGGRPGVINIQNYPQIWADKFVGLCLYRDDPVVQACLRRSQCFCWSQLSDMITLSPRQKEILSVAAREGLSEGITAPFAVPGELPGSCTLAAPMARLRTVHLSILADCVGAAASEAARRLVTPDALHLPARRLHDRQRDCVLASARGLQLKEIARATGLSVSTVKTYLEDAIQRLGVRRRSQIVSRALALGEISFAEIDAFAPRVTSRYGRKPTAT